MNIVSGDCAASRRPSKLQQCMGGGAMGFVRLLAAGLLLLLAGCGGSFTTIGDFTTVAPRVAPIAPGRYVVATSPDDAGLLFALRESGDYAVTLGNDQPPLDVAVFGPLEGFYIAQLRQSEPAIGSAATYGNFVFSIGADASLSIVDDLALRTALGDILFGGLGITTDQPPAVGALTDNAALNWAILQRALAAHAASFTYQGKVLPAATQ